MNYVKKFERILYLILLILLGIVLIVSIFDLAILLFENLFDGGVRVLENNELLDLFSLFLLVLIGVEFFETMVAYLRENVIHAEIVIIVAIIAVARKIILVESSGSDLHLIGLGILILALGVTYYLIKKAKN